MTHCVLDSRSMMWAMPVVVLAGCVDPVPLCTTSRPPLRDIVSDASIERLEASAPDVVQEVLEEVVSPETGPEIPLVSPFAEQLYGTWFMMEALDVVVRSGWIRFEPLSAETGTGQVRFLGTPVESYEALFTCSDVGTWSLRPEPNAVRLLPPASCTGLVEVMLTFQDLNKGPDAAIPKALLEGGAVWDMGGVQGRFAVFKFDNGICDAEMTTCQNPFSY